MGDALEEEEAAAIFNEEHSNFIPETIQLRIKDQGEGEDDGKGSKLDGTKILPQLLAAFAALIGAFSFGNVLCFSSVSMPKLREDSTFPHSSEDEISWMSSVVTLGALASCLPAGWAADKFGRRNILLLLTIPFVIGWLLIYFANSVSMLIAGRFITGCCGGGFTLISPIFLAEISEPQIRGMLISGFDMMANFGFVFIATVGKFTSWRIQALICAIPPIFHAILLFVPESPRFLLFKGQEEKALKSLCWFRGVRNWESSTPLPSSVKSEFNCLKEAILLQRRKGQSQGYLTEFKANVREMSKRSVLKSLVIIFLLFFFREFSGILAVDFYTVDIFLSAGSNVDAYTCAIIVYSVSSVISIGTALLVDRLGRKRLLIVSELVAFTSLCGLGLFFYIKEKDAKLAVDNLGLLPLASVVLFLAGYVIGVGPIPFSIMPELLPQRVRGSASSLMLAMKWIMSFVVARYFKNYIDLVGDAFTYWTFAAVCLLGLSFVLFFLPETTGKTLEQIQREMQVRSKKPHDQSQKI